MRWMRLRCLCVLPSVARALSLPSLSSYAEEVRLGLAAVEEAMAMAKKVQTSCGRTTKTDSSPVTIADFAAQAMVLSRLEASYPSDGFVAEESSSNLSSELAEETAAAAGMALAELTRAIDLGAAAGDGRRRWILDPIDGTKGFLRGEQFCCALCLAVDGVPVASILGCPNLDGGTYAVAAAGAGAFARAGDDSWRRLSVATTSPGETLTLVEGVARSHSNHDWSRAAVDLVAPATRTVRLDSQAKAVILCQAKADAFIRLPRLGYDEKVWDIAPAYLLVTEAGGAYTDRRGRPLDFSLGSSLAPDVDGVIATSAQLHPYLVDALAQTEHLQE